MALINPSGLYNGSAPLNPLPYVNIAIQARNRKDAREDAIDKYYRDLPTKINDKGVRDQDREYLESLRNDIFDKGLRYKDALRKNDGAAKLEVEQSMRKFAGEAEKSKNLAKRGLERGKAYLSKENRWVVDDDEYIAAEDLESKAINDPLHQEMDMAKILSNRPYDEKEYAKEIKDKVKYGTKAIRAKDPSNPLYDIVSEVPDLDKTAKEKIYALGVDKYHGNKRFAKMIDSLKPEQLSELNEISKEVFGHYIREDFAPEDISAAYSVLQLPVTSTKEKSQQNTGAVMDKRRKEGMEDWEYKTAVQQRNSLIKIAANQQGQQIINGTTGNALDEFGSITTEYLPSGGKVEKGIVYDKDGNLYSGEMAIQREKLPANVSTALTAAKIPLNSYMNIVVKDGIIQAIRTKNGEVSRQAMENLQKKANTEPVKAPQPVYGKPSGTKTTSKNYKFD